MPAMHLDEQEIFEVARKIEPGTARDAYLQQVCGDDALLGQRVRALLQAYEAGTSFLEPPIQGLAATRPPQVSERPGMQIGPYKLLQQLGEGGMGTVYMAEQSHPVQRKVALKVIKAGMDSGQVIARFEAERQALAMMDHQCIAKVFEAGTTDAGRPYFVMELVKGVPITEYCDAHPLCVTQRLELMVALCQAVQHAHQKGIIHRDIKPSNVLVAEYDGQPVPKIIDFGVAKATAQRLTERTMFTEYGQLIGTFEYMSPEQASFNQLDVDTRSDIYSLGVLLYELLAGSTPLEKERLRSAAFDEILRMIREEEPPKPSTRLSSSDALPSIAANRGLEPAKLNRLVQGELDWIVMKCLEKERDKRYGSAEQVADEFRRFLAGEPIQARSTTMRQRMWRWYRRHVPLVAGAYTVFTFLLFAVHCIVLFSIIQFLIRSPNASEILSGFGLMAMTVLVCLAGAEMGIAAFRGKRRGLWMSLIAFVVFSLGQCWWLSWSIGISREISADPVYAVISLSPDTLEGRNAYIRNSVIGFSVLGIAWSLVGLVLQVHALCSQAPGQNLVARRSR
jgi:serine/threonine protein kinase